MPWIILIWWLTKPKAERVAPPSSIVAPAVATDGSAYHCRPGPWGELEYGRIVIEPPEDFVMANYPEPQEIVWKFPGYTPTKLAELWRAAGLDPTQLQAEGSPLVCETAPAGIVVKAGKDFVLNLNASARTKLYTTLASFPENAAQHEPFRFRADFADEWFENSGLSEASMAFVKSFLYRRGTSLIFSDHDVVLPKLPSPEERSRLVKTLSRRSTLLLKLRVRHNSDIEQLSQYWCRGPRSKDVKPLLLSAARQPSETTLDVVHLLPRFARALMYTYPWPSDDPRDTNRDCFWTALNFFRQEPDERLTDIEFVKKTLLEDYFPVPGESTFGDVLIFTKPDGTAIHACVYIADDIVFTKNGSSFAMPWILMTLADVQAFYPAEEPFEVRRYRSKQY